MRIFSRIFFALIFLIFVCITVCYIYVRLNGQQMVTAKLSEAFDREVTMEDIHFLFPSGLRILDLNIQGMMKIKDVQIQMGIPDLVHKRLRFLFMSLADPEITLVRNADSSVVFGDPKTKRHPAGPAAPPPVVEKPPTPVDPADKSIRPLSFIVDYLVVNRGQINFSDFSRQRDFHLTLQDINLKGQNAAYPILDVNTKFDLTATVKKEDMPLSGSRVVSRGVFNLVSKNMDAKIQVIETDGTEGLSTILQSKNNDMLVKGKLQISNLVSKIKNEPPSPKEASFKDLIFTALQSSGVEIVADFHFKTKMDDFQPEEISFVGNVGYQPETPAEPKPKDTPEDPLQNMGEHFEEFGRKFYKEKIQEPVPVKGTK